MSNIFKSPPLCIPWGYRADLIRASNIILLTPLDVLYFELNYINPYRTITKLTKFFDYYRIAYDYRYYFTEIYNQYFEQLKAKHQITKLLRKK